MDLRGTGSSTGFASPGDTKYIDDFTEVYFDIDFEIENKFLNIVMAKSFQFGLDKIADAFQKRAKFLFSDR